MFRRIKVSGESLSPDFKEGDFVITVKVPLFLRFLHPGDVVVFHQSPHGTLIKRVEWIDTIFKSVFVIGTHESSVDSRTFGPVPEKNLIGKVIWHIPRPRAHGS